MTNSVFENEELSVEAVKDRFRWARDNGFATWLWPDVEVAEWRRALAAITNATRSIVSGKSSVNVTYDNVATFGLASYTSGMGPLLGLWSEQGLLEVTPGVSATLAKHLLHNRKRQATLASIARDITAKLIGEGIYPTILKGMHTAYVYFEDPGTRPAADIDIYIPSDQRERVCVLLARLGYEPIVQRTDPWQCDWVPAGRRKEPYTLCYLHRDDPWYLDITDSLDRPLATGGRIPFDRFLPTMTPGSWPLLEGVRTLPQPILSLYLAAHISEALQNITLIRVFELVQVLQRDSHSGALDWDAFLECAKTIGPRFAFPALHFCEELAPGVVPTPVLQACEADTPIALKRVIGDLTLARAEPLGRHSLRERFLWAHNWQQRLGQLRLELGFDRQGRNLIQLAYSFGTKLRAIGRGRLKA